MNSMTGFGHAEGTPDHFPAGFRVELSSINRKQFELKLAIPREIAFYENQLRNLVAERISRGALMLRIDLFSTDRTNTESLPSGGINTILAKTVCESAKKLKKELGLAGELNLSDILAVPGIIELPHPDYNTPELEKALLNTVSIALERMIETRRKEGANLRIDIEKRLKILRDELEQIEPFVKTMPILQREKLLQRLREANLECDPNDERILRELVIFADKADVTEEITRLKSHFHHFETTLKNDSNAVGRSLDFMTQEIFREINTLGNKAASVEVSPRIVVMKTELEKIREQIQNIE